MFELHFTDSELLAPRWQAGTLVLAFAAALVRPLGDLAGEVTGDLADETAGDGEASGPEVGHPWGPGLGHGAGLGQGLGLGHVRGLSLHLTDALVSGDIASAVGRLAQGNWQAEGQPPRRRLSVPMAADRPVRLSLVLANGTAIDIRATAWRAIFSGAPDYRESLAC